MRTADFGVRHHRLIRRLIEAREQSATGGTDPNGEFVDEFRVAASGLHSLLLIVRELERPRFSVSRLGREWPQHSPWSPPDSKARAWWALFDRINRGLAATPMALWWVRSGQPTEGCTDDFEPGPPFMLHPATPRDLYGVCILEVADHVMEGNPYRVCANETCNRLILCSRRSKQVRRASHRQPPVPHTVVQGRANPARLPATPGRGAAEGQIEMKTERPKLPGHPSARRAVGRDDPLRR